MARTLEQIRNNGLTSIYGRIFGKTKTSSGSAAGFDGEFIGGPKDMIKALQDLTTATSGTAVPNYGYSRQTATGSSQGPTQHLLDAPEIGVEKCLILATSSTGSHQYLTTAAGAAVLDTTSGTTKGVINMLSAGCITLVGLTTALWGIKTMTPYGSSAGVNTVSFTTST